MLTIKFETFPGPDVGPVLMTVVPFSQVAVPDPVEEVPMSVSEVLVQVNIPFAVAIILTVGAWLF